MDYYTQAFVDAQNEAQAILFSKKGRCFDQARNSDFYLDDGYHVSAIRHWYRMDSYRLNSDLDRSDRNNALAANSWIRAAEGAGGVSVFEFLNIAGENEIIYGSTSDNSSRAFTTKLAECVMNEIRPGYHSFARTGLFTGTLSSSGFSDALISSGLRDYYVANILISVPDSEIENMIRNNIECIDYLRSHETFHRYYGTGSRRDEERKIPEISKAISLLEEENNYLQSKMGNGFIRTVVRYGASSDATFSRLTALIQAGFDYEDTEGFVPVHHFEIGGECNGIEECLAVPIVRICSDCYNGDIHALTLQDTASAASFCKPPMRSNIGFYVRNYSVNEDSYEAFPLTQLKNAGSEALIKIGQNVDYGTDVTIPLKMIHSHMSVYGATETGKSTTIRKILSELYGRGISFTVIEAAKKDYYKLAGSIRDMRIFTAGADGEQFLINPLQPEDGVLIENHVDAVVRSILASSGGEHPIPEAFKGLLRQTYEKFGWRFGMLAYTDESRPFPTFKDAAGEIDDYIATHAMYGPEVKQNLFAALFIRTSAMHEGALGNLFSARTGLQAKDILNTPAVIELADFSEEAASFLMSIVLFKIHSYLSRQPECRDLKRVVVLEEAHNVFRKTQSEDSGRAVNNNYFEKLLAEIACSGTGIIISDQRPSMMSEAVSANTSVKIIHALVSDEDASIVAPDLRLTDFQKKKLKEFRTGECVISIRGEYGVDHCQVEPAKETALKNEACLICANRLRCASDAVYSMLENSEPSVISYHISRIVSEPYNPQMVAGNVNNMLRALNVNASDSFKLCLLGTILKRYGNDSVQTSRIIINQYRNYLKRRNS